MVSLTSLLVVKILIVLANTISNSQVFLLKKCEYKATYTHMFSAKILAYMPIFNDQSFNDMLINSIVNFEQLGSCNLSTVLYKGYNV